jgi:GNAT superfamily N-acetyltransferase
MATSTSSQASIRLATPEDAQEIFNMIHELAAYEKEPPSTVEATPTSLLKTLRFSPPLPDSQNLASCFIAEVEESDGTGKKIAGFALWFTNYSTWRGKGGVYLEDLFVRPQFRRLGLGKKLLSELAKEVLKMDGGRLEWSVLKWNEPSINFYLSDAVGAVRMEGWVGMRVEREALVKLAGQ